MGKKSNYTKIQKKTKLSKLSPYLLHIFKVLEVLPRTIRQRKKMKEMQIGKVKVSWSADAMTAYISDPEDSNEEFLQLINTFSKEVGYK